MTSPSYDNKVLFMGEDLKQVMADNPSKVPVLLISESPKLLVKEPEFLFPLNAKIIVLVGQIKKRLKVSSEQSITLFCKNKTMALDRNIADMYSHFRDEDLILRVHVRVLESFGSNKRCS